MVSNSADNTDDTLFFTIRKGEVWICWLDARSPVKLGACASAMSAMREFLSEQDADAKDDGENPSQLISGEREDRKFVERTVQRHDVSITGKIRTSRGANTVTVQDISTDGCQIYDDIGGHSRGDRVTIRIGTIGPIAAIVSWTSGRRLGVSFESALHSYVVDHIRGAMDTGG